MTHHAILTADAHRDLRVRPGGGETVMSAITVPDEFRQVQNEYPIVFRRNPDRDSFSALALFGFEAGENLFVENGRWDARYRPLAIEIEPFLVGMPADGSDAKQVHIDLASPRLDAADGVRVFDVDGRPTPYLEKIADQLGALDAGYQGTGDFLNALRRHELLEPLTLEVTLDDGSINRLIGFHVIDEARLRALDAAALDELHRDGYLMPIFMALASLSNFTNLIARKNRRTGRG